MADAELNGMAGSRFAKDELRFDDKVALVTGAGRGMGREHAHLLARRGAKVVVSDLGVDLYGNGSDSGPAQEVVDTIRAAGGEAIAFTGDLADPGGARGAVLHALEHFGRIDALVHNAGFTLGSCPFGSEDPARLDKLLSINTRAAFILAREAWPHMERQSSGRVVLVASTAIYGLAGSLPYSTAKSSFIGMTRGLAAEGAKSGIKVNLVSPAGATRMSGNMADSELKDWLLTTARVDLVSPLVALLCHEACPVSGELFVAGGGRIARTVIGETRGWIDPDMTVEDVLQAMPAILADEPASEPRTTGESLGLFLDVMSFKLSTPLSEAGTVKAAKASEP
ncbi:MAG: SDR family NAD(P)-dependent oxidoreductase [Alphaproteobacteria bacterium]|nr:SDR family NAD(P)-dependent oxidoreductase [Alphaproteobacteria bacterium]